MRDAYILLFVCALTLLVLGEIDERRARRKDKE